MEQKTFKSSYEAPCLDVELIEVEDILCMSGAGGQNEPFDELDNEYNFAW